MKSCLNGSSNVKIDPSCEANVILHLTLLTPPTHDS